MMDLSLVVPCYQEAEHICGSVEHLVEAMDISVYSYELIFVDDGSPDQTVQYLEKLCDKYPFARLLRHRTNKGRGAAFKTGVREARGEIVGFIDIDQEVDALFIPPIVNLIKAHHYDVVTGLRYYVLSQTCQLHRHIASSGYRVLMRLLTGVPLLDTETGCKFFYRDRCTDVIFDSENDGWFWDTEVMVRSYLGGLNIFEMPVLFLKKREKKSTVKLIPDSIQYIKDLLAFRRRIGLAYLDKSPIYWDPFLYKIVMEAIGKGAAHVFKEISELISDGASVVDLCAGDGGLYTDRLKGQDCIYLGFEWNSMFVRKARKRGIDVRFADVRRATYPKADYVIMCSSLYHFFNEIDFMMKKMTAAAIKGVVIAEPVINYSSSGNFLIGKLAKTLSKTGLGCAEARFDEDSFRRALEPYSPKSIKTTGDKKYCIAYIEK